MTALRMPGEPENHVRVQGEKADVELNMHRVWTG